MVDLVVTKAINNGSISLRNGLNDIFQFTSTNILPVSIFSAGLANILKIVLQ